MSQLHCFSIPDQFQSKVRSHIEKIKVVVALKILVTFDLLTTYFHVHAIGAPGAEQQFKPQLKFMSCYKKKILLNTRLIASI